MGCGHAPDLRETGFAGIHHIERAACKRALDLGDGLGGWITFLNEKMVNLEVYGAFGHGFLQIVHPPLRVVREVIPDCDDQIADPTTAPDYLQRRANYY
jgi:hypothetical protein